MVLENDVIIDEQVTPEAHFLPLHETTPSPACEFEDFLDSILTWSASTFGQEELIAAKEEFYWKTGKVFHDDPFYDARMIYFQDYFLFQRPLESGYVGNTPYSAYTQLKTTRPSGGFLITSTCHSLFQVLKSSRSCIVVTDLFTKGSRINVQSRNGQSFCAIRKKDIFQGFLYEAGELTYASDGLVFHPKVAAPLLKKQAKTQMDQAASDKFRSLSRWAHLQVRHLRHQHVDARRIYDDPLR